MKIINFSKPKQALRMLRRKGPPPPIAVPGNIHLPPTAPRAIAAVPPPHPDVQEQEPTAEPDTELEYEEMAATTSEAVHPQPLKKIKKKALLIGIQLVREKPVEPLTALSPLSPRFAIANVDAGIQRAKTKYRAKKRARAIRKSGVLKGPHKDVAAMKNLLINVYNYAEEDIVVLIDDDDANHKQPTKANIMDEMRKLVAGAEENDRFFFHFSGHSMQEDTDDIEEEDRKNEFIMTSDGDSIKDDILKATLVEPLPANSSLIAVFDSCHSGSLLDLKHFRCNRVYVPWLNRGTRRTASRFQFTHRRPAKISPVQSPLRRKLAKIHEHWARTSIDNVVLNSDSVGSPISSLPVPVPTIQEPAVVISSPMHDAASETASNTNHVKVVLPETFVHQHQQQHQNPCQQQHHQSTGGRSSLSVITDIQKRGFWLTDSYCSSPAELYCTGFCRDPDNSAYMLAGTAMADVISISSAKDGQLSWEDGDGASTLTQSLVRILEKDPHLTFHDLMTLVSHDIHSYYVDLHSRARDYRKKVRLANNEKVKKGQKPRPGKEVEMNNFQNPQLSSERPLDMTRRFYP